MPRPPTSSTSPWPLPCAPPSGGPASASLRRSTRSEGDGATARWNDLLTALYAGRAALGPGQFDAALAVVRGTLRARLDRTLRYAR